MTNEPRKIFRDKALEHLSSPEQLDQILQVVNRKSWIPLAACSGLLLVGLLWSVFGRIPVTVGGVGLLAYPRQVVSFQLPASGQIVALNVKVGDLVKKGQILGHLNQPALEQSLDQERVRLAELRARDSRLDPIFDERMKLERDANERERRVLQQRIQSTLRTAETQRAKNEASFVKQRESLEQLRAVKVALNENFKTRYDNYQKLMAEGLVSSEAVLNVRQGYIDNQAQIAELEVQVRDREVQQLRAEEAYQQQLEVVANLETQVRQLDIRSRELAQRQLETVSDADLRIQEVERTIARYEEDLRTKSQIVSEYAGRVLEVTASVGQIVNAGQRLGAIETDDAGGRMLAVGYFQVSDGKRIEPGMDVRIAPATVERERYGSMLAKVISVSPFAVTTDAVTNVVGNAEVAQGLLAGGTKIEVFAELMPDSASFSGYRWTSGHGPDVRITPGTTGEIRATIEYRRPITFFIPIVRRWSGA
jgi:HlyD family secretion protein